MRFELPITRDTTEIRLKIMASARCALVQTDSAMFFVSVLADTTSPPRIDIKSLTSRQMPLTNFLRPSRDETECLAITSGAIIFLLRLGQ
jgi:hypothetical protein